jgi:hypothetical protein
LNTKSQTGHDVTNFVDQDALVGGSRLTILQASFSLLCSLLQSAGKFGFAVHVN